MKDIHFKKALLTLSILFACQAHALELKTSYGSINAGYANWNTGFEKYAPWGSLESSC